MDPLLTIKERTSWGYFRWESHLWRNLPIQRVPFLDNSKAASQETLKACRHTGRKLVFLQTLQMIDWDFSDFPKTTFPGGIGTGMNNQLPFWSLCDKGTLYFFIERMFFPKDSDLETWIHNDFPSKNLHMTHLHFPTSFYWHYYFLIVLHLHVIMPHYNKIPLYRLEYWFP